MARATQGAAPTPGAPASGGAPPPVPRRRRRWPWAVAALLLLPPLLVAGVLASAWQSLHTEAGTRWWLQQVAERVPGLALGASRGALLGAQAGFALDSLALRAGGSTVRADDLRIDGLQLGRWQWRAPYLRVEAREVALRRLDVSAEPAPDPKPDEPPVPPADLRLPLTARVDLLRIERLQLPGLAVPIENLAAHLEAGDTHRIDALTLRWNGLLAAGSAHIDATPPMALRARLAVRDGGAEPPTEPSAQPLPAWTKGLALEIAANGPLERFDATAQLSLQDQRLDASAQVTPFAALPLSQLDARFAQLDLAPLLAPFTPQAPSTALTGSAVLRLAPDAPLSVRAQLSNALPGRWDQQRLPLRSLSLSASGQGADWRIDDAVAQFAADAGTPAGALRGSGRLEGGVGAIELLLDGVLPHQLDRRAPPLRLSGPIKLKHTPDASTPGPAAVPAPPALPASPASPPAPSSGAVPPAAPAGAAPAAQAPAAAPTFGLLEFDARIEGALLGEARNRVRGPLRNTVQLAARGSARPSELVLQSLRVQAGQARLNGQGRARRDGQAWATEATLELAAFDPRVWLPGEPQAPWRRAPSRLNGKAELRARVPAEAADAAALFARLEGRLSAELADSTLAGQPLALSLKAQADGAGRLEANGQSEAVGNQARFALQLQAPGGRAVRREERFDLQLDAPALARLAPLAELFGLAPLAGSAQVTAQVEGGLGGALLGGGASGPLTTRGSLEVRDLQAATLQVGAADGEWNATLPAGGSPGSSGGRAAGGTQALASAVLQARLKASELRLPAVVVPTLSLEVDGSLADHRARLRAHLRQPTPAPGSAASAAPAATTPTPLALATDLNGAWQAGAAGGAPAAWRATLSRLSLQPVGSETGRPPADGAQAGGAQAGSGQSGSGQAEGEQVGGATAGRDPAPPVRPPTGTASSRKPAGSRALPLVVANDLRFVLEHGEQSLAFRMEPGRAELLGAVLRWSRLQWQRSGTAPPQLAVQAEVEPIVVAELLQRLQPDFGWAGDLRVGARIDVSSDPAVRAQVEIARTGGDLQVSEFGTVQSLGLTDARVALDVQNGVWRLTELIAGANLGRIEGRQTVRTEPTALWPPPQAPIDGQLDVRVENLAAWGVWVPAGWRLGGELDASLRVAGRVGAPELIGEVQGRDLALRNVLEGVALREGRLVARFEGTSARLEVLSFKAGRGELRASGTAQLGAEPQARLELVADEALVLGRVDRRIVASGDLALRLDAMQIAVTGDLRVDRGLIDISQGDAPSLGDDVTVRRPGDTAAADAEAAAEAKASAPRAVDLQLAIDLGERLQLRGRGIDTRLTGRLQLTNPNGLLTARGEIRTVDGTYEAYGQDLQIEQGVITFVGPLENPRLNIEAVRANTDVRVGVRVTGSVLQPRIQLFSDPEMPATEKLALLVTGRSYDDLAGSETLLLQRAALALLAGDGSGGSAFDPARLLRLDELSVSQTEGAVPDTVVTLGKQLSDRVYVGYARGLNAAAGNWQLIYRIAQRFTVRAQSGEDPAVDLIWMFRWN